MAYLGGIAVALFAVLLGRLAGLDRDRAFYPTLLIITATYYVLFAVMGGSMPALLFEAVVMILFTALAVMSFKSSLWLVVVMFAGHGVFDLVHARLVSNPGVPSWWPAFCMAIDVALAGILAWLFHSRTLGTRAEIGG